MKKTNILKIFMTLVLAFVISGAFAQLNDPAGDYTSTDTDATHKVTIGTRVPFWVEPDSYFNPGFEAAVNAVTGAALQTYISGAKAEIVSTFVWSVPTAPAGGVATPSNQSDNYVEYTFTVATGDYVLSVVETAGACPGTAETMTVTVVDEPTMAWVTADQDGCSPVTSAVIADITGDLDGDDMTLFWSFTASNVDSDWDGVFPVDAAYNETDITAAAAAAESVSDFDFASGTAQFFAATGNQTLIASQDWDAMNSAITIYTFTLEGVTDKVSRKSDYLNVFSAADLTDETIYTQYGTSDVVRIVVRPAPATGPIYHITNSWGL